MNISSSRLRPRGFSLVEVMVAMVVICVGLLGVAKMQALSLANTTIARQRSIAAIEAASLAAAMRANRLYWGAASNFTLTWNPAVAPVFTGADPGSTALATAANIGNAHACDGAAGAVPMCAYAANNQALAAADVVGWANALSAVLPNPRAVINCGVAFATLPPSCTINISWSETSVAINAQEAAQEATQKLNNSQGQFELPAYQLYVEP